MNTIFIDDIGLLVIIPERNTKEDILNLLPISIMLL